MAIRPSADPARKFWKNFSTSRDSVSAVSVRLPAAVNTEDAAVSVSPMASRSEVMLATRVSLPCAALCALEEISRVAASCWPMAPAIAEVTSLISRTAPPISRTASTALRVEVWIIETFSLISAVALAVWPASVFTS
ncbi:hypothetical protein ABH981_006564 [Bradyrhizobium ottawaense]